MSDGEQNSNKKLSFKHEWNNFSIYCWTLMEKCMSKLNDEEKDTLKKNVTEATTSLGKVRSVMANKPIMDYLHGHVDYLNTKNAVDQKRKDNKFAYNCKKIGDVYFNKNRFQKALKFYTKAILFFEKDEELEQVDNESNDEADDLDETISLSQLLICRARTLIRLEKLTDAYSDFKQALALEPEIKSQDIDIDNLALYYKPSSVDFKLTGTNEKLDGASGAVRMGYCDEKGRLMKAERKIEEGEILFMEEPYVHWLRPTYFELYCHQCLKKLNKHIYTPCDHCTEIRFCSTGCKEVAWKRYHKIECKYLKLLKKWPSGHMALRLLLRDGIEYVLKEDLKADIPLDEWPKIGFKADYSAIRSLTGENNFTDGDYYCPLIIGCIMIALLFEMSNEIQKQELEQFSALLIKSIMQILENTFMIYDYDIKAIDEDDFLDDEPTHRSLNNQLDRTRFHQMSSVSYKIGVGLYSTTSLIPHSCDNNSNKYYFGSSILIVASRPIECSEEVNIEYGVHYKMNSLKYRKEYLKNNFGFDCQCSACLNKLENEGLSFKCLKCLTGALIRNQDQSNYCLNCKAKDLDMTVIDVSIKRAEEHFQAGMEAYKANNIKKAETEFRLGEKICAKIYYNDVKLQFIKSELSHLYLMKKNYALAYQYLYHTLPINKNLYGDNSIEVLTNHIELACLAVECIQNYGTMGFSVKQASQKWFRQLLIKMKTRSNQNKQQAINLDSVSLEEIDKKLTSCDELLKWKLIFKRHYQAIIQLYLNVARRQAKIASDESIHSLGKLNQLKKFLNTIDN